jgi:hypothetical protein
MKNDVLTPEQEARIVALIRTELERPPTFHLRVGDAPVAALFQRVLDRLSQAGVTVIIDRSAIEQE